MLTYNKGDNKMDNIEPNKIFKLNKDYKIKCYWQETDEGFKHIAELLKRNKILAIEEIQYLNRTWELYEFESILRKVISVINNRHLYNVFLDKIIKQDF